MLRKKNLDNLSSDILTADFLEIFHVVHYIQWMFGFLRVDIKYKYVTAPSVAYQIYSSLVWLVTTLSMVYCVLYCKTVFDSVITEYFYKFGFFINHMTNALIACYNNFHNGNRNSQLYVELQKIDHDIDMPDSKSINKSTAMITNALVLVGSLGGVTSVLIQNLLLMAEFYPAAQMVLTLGMGSYTDILLFSIILYYITIRIDFINITLGEITNRKNFDQVWMVRYSRKLENQINELVIGFHGVINVLSKSITLFELPIFGFMSQFMLWVLIVMENFTKKIQEQKVTVSSILPVLSAIAYLLTVVPLLCFLTTSLNTKLEKTRALCKRIKIYSEEGKTREHADQMLMLLDAKRDFTIYDIFTLSWQLPLHMLSVTATYTIVIFQFALL